MKTDICKVVDFFFLKGIFFLSFCSTYKVRRKKSIRMLQGTRRMDSADFGSFQPSVMTLCLPSQYHHHHPHLSHGTSAPPDSFRSYGGGGNPSSAAAAVAAAAADLSLFAPMSDSIKHHYGGGTLGGGGGGSQPSHKLMSIIKSQAGLSEAERISISGSKARSTVPSSSASSPTRPSPHHFNLVVGKEVSSGVGVSATGGGMHPSLSPWFIQQQQQQQPIGSSKKRRQLSESASGRYNSKKKVETPSVW